MTLTGKFSPTKGELREDGLCTIEYTSNSLEEEKAVLYVDGIASDPVTIVPSLDKAASKEDAIGTLIDSLVNPEIDSSSSANDTLATITGVLTSATPEEKQKLQESLVKSDNYGALESKYIQENQIEVKPAFDFTIAVDGSDTSELIYPVKITSPIPVGFEVTKMKLFHIHDDKESEVPFTVSSDQKSIEFIATKFSPYVFVQSDGNTNSNSNSSSSGGGSSTTRSSGQWVLNSTGWFTDKDGRIYYLNPVSNGFLGALQTGWQMIDGYWYYFNVESDGYRGMLFVNTVTPDGYHVNDSGQRME